MMLRQALRLCALAATVTFGLCGCAQAQRDNETAAGQVRTYATLHCLGIEWPIAGDADHDATCHVEYRKARDTAWKKALPLLRVDTDRSNALTGSIFFLDPGAPYEVRLRLSDPDGGDQTVTLQQRTRSLPALPANGRRFHVAPGAGGGDGSEAAPFRGLGAAQAAAQPGDVLLLYPGDYGKFRFTRSGAPGRPICWRGHGEGDAVLAGAQVTGDNLWFEGLTFRCRDPRDEDGLSGETSVHNTVVIRNQFIGFHNAIVIGRGNRDWYIADNVIEGDAEGRLSGEGVELGKSRGHVVAHNRISRVADAVSYPGSDCDIFGNDILDVSDDGVETDMGQQNNRVWGNRVTNAYNNVFSFQPMNRGPWYFIRNQVVLTRGMIWKFSDVNDRFVSLHNTFVFPKMASQYAQCFLMSFSRNNLYVAYGDESPMWRGQWHPRKPGEPGRGFTPDWMTDLDYDGFDWGAMTEPFRWDGKPYNDLATFAREVGIEAHSLRVEKEDIFEDWTAPIAAGKTELVHMTLREGCRAVDSGAAVPNINDDFVGEGPDLGALERGKSLPHYGPRGRSLSGTHAPS